jgi:hypothetical protein
VGLRQSGDRGGFAQHSVPAGGQTQPQPAAIQAFSASRQAFHNAENDNAAAQQNSPYGKIAFHIATFFAKSLISLTVIYCLI